MIIQVSKPLWDLKKIHVCACTHTHTHRVTSLTVFSSCGLKRLNWEADDKRKKKLLNWPSTNSMDLTQWPLKVNEVLRVHLHYWFNCSLSCISLFACRPFSVSSRSHWEASSNFGYSNNLDHLWGTLLKKNTPKRGCTAWGPATLYSSPYLTVEETR